MSAAAALLECLGPGVAAPAGTTDWMQDWAAAGFEAPTRGPRLQGPPDPRGADPARWGLERRAAPGELRRAAQWAAAAEFDGRQREAALDFLTDALGIGASSPIAGIVPEAAAAAILGPPETSSAEAHLWRPAGDRRTTSLPQAVLWNRLSGDALELHAGPEVVAGVVAAAEHGDRTVEEVLDALAVGAGVSSWHRNLVGGALEEAGVHSPGALAPVSTAAAVGRLLGHRARTIEAAMIRADRRMPIHPYRAFAEGATVKLAYGAWGQAVGLQAALEAADRPLPPRSAPGAGSGFDAGEAGSDFDAGEAGSDFDAGEAGGAVTRIVFKKYPGSRAIAPALAALERLPRFDPDEIATVDVGTYPFSDRLSSWVPPDAGPIGRQMHIPTAVALFLRSRYRGERLGAASFARRDDGLPALVARVRVSARDFGNPDAPPGSRIRRARIRVTLRSGAVREAESGAPFAPPPAGALRKRFRELSRGSSLVEPWKLPLSAPVSDLFPPERGGADIP